MPKIKIVIQSRLSSTRLPAKALLPVAGYPAVILCALRARNTGLDVAVATSVDSSDDPLAAELKKASIPVFRGPLDDVLERFHHATKDLSSDDIIVRMTADNLIPDGEFAGEMVAALLARQSQYIGTNSPLDKLPYGLSAEAFSVRVLREAMEKTMDPYDREHVTPWIRRHYEEKLFTSGHLNGDYSYLRCTLDTFDDYLRLVKIFEAVNDPVGASWKELIAILTKMPGEPDGRVPYRVKNKTLQSQLSLGTVQLGTPYGIANKTGLPSIVDSTAIIRKAISYGITTLDTARAYGEAERRIGSALTGGMSERVKVITKLSPLSNLQPDAGKDNVISAVEASIFRSCCELRIRSLPVLMLHRWSHHDDFHGAIWERLLELKQEGFLQDLGASVQTPEEGLAALEDPDVKHIQIPFNLLDGRWKKAGFDQKALRRNDVMIYARSAYLQGLLISPSEIWPRIDSVNPEEWLDKIDFLVKETGRESRKDLCLAYVRTQGWIDSIVIGMETEEQLIQNTNLFRNPILTAEEMGLVEKTLDGAPENLLNPAKWKSS